MAGNFLNKILNFIGLEEYEVEEEGQQVREQSAAQEYRNVTDTYIDSRKKKGKIVNIHTVSNVKVVVYQPFSYDDAQSIIDNLKSRKPVIVNLEYLDLDLAQRVLDFMSGAVYALDGSIRKIAKGIFLLAPSNVDIMGNIPEELKGKNFFTLAQKKDKEE